MESLIFRSMRVLAAPLRWKSSACGRPARAAFAASCPASPPPTAGDEGEEEDEEGGRVCIVGAGPVGLCLSLLLAQQGVRTTEW